MKLNPLKCSFGVSSGKFLGFIVHARGIEANPEQVRALQDIKIPSTRREMQSLNGKVATLSRFISKATDKYIPFFEALKKDKGKFEWTDECSTAFLDLIDTSRDHQYSQLQMKAKNYTYTLLYRPTL